MKKSVFFKISVTIMLLLLVISNISYAVEFDSEKFQNSLKNNFSKNVRFKTELTLNGEKTEKELNYAPPKQLIVTSNKVVIGEVVDENGTAMDLDINLIYTITDNTVKFNIESDVAEFVNKLGGQTELEGIAKFLLYYYNVEVISLATASVSESLGIDPNIVLSYINQVAKGESAYFDEAKEDYKTSVECDTFKREINYIESNKKVISMMEINLEELKKINASSLDGSYNTTLIIEEPEYQVSILTNDSTVITPNTNNVGDTINKANTLLVKNTVSDVNANKANTSRSNYVNNSNDRTSTNNEIPETGDGSLYGFLLVFTIVSIYIYFRFKKYDDVK